MPGDIVSGGYPLTNPLLGLLGGLSNVVQSNIPARSNLEWGIGDLSDGALAATGVGIVVPCPVAFGTVVSKVSVLIGATAGATMSHQFAALYQGTGAAPALMAQSADTTSAAIGASALASWTLATPQVITPTNAPSGFVYVLLSITATTVPTAVSMSAPTGIQYQWVGTTSPLKLAATAGSSLGGTAAATIASPSGAAVGPVVLLT